MTNLGQNIKLKTNRKYKAPLIEVVLLDQEMALVMSSESPIPPPEFLKIFPVISRAYAIAN
jgi:hypothetical protein